VTGAAELGWRLFATRNLLVSASAWRGDASARDSFLPVQAAVVALVMAHQRPVS